MTHPISPGRMTVRTLVAIEVRPHKTHALAMGAARSIIGVVTDRAVVLTPGVGAMNAAVLATLRNRRLKVDDLAGGAGEVGLESSDAAQIGGAVPLTRWGQGPMTHQALHVGSPGRCSRYSDRLARVG